jgi:cytochrome c oxidase subunit 1
MYSEPWAKFAALLVFMGFNLTFLPQFVLGYLGMPRRYAAYPAEFQTLNVLSSAGATVLGVAFLIPMIYLTYSWFWGPKVGRNPWEARGLEWQIPSPPITLNFEETPIVTQEVYNYGEPEVLEVGR